MPAILREIAYGMQVDIKQEYNMLSAMNKPIENNTPVSQAQYQQGRQDGLRYYGEGHLEMLDGYWSGTPSYQMGFDSSKELSAAVNPGYAS